MKKQKLCLLFGLIGLLVSFCGCKNVIVDSIYSLVNEKSAVETTKDLPELENSENSLASKTEIIKEDIKQVDQSERAVLINLNGYETTEKKIAVFRGTRLDNTFDIINAETGKVVFSGYIIEAKENAINKETNAKGDFSELNAPGTYYISTSSLGNSSEFVVENGHYEKLLDQKYEALRNKLNGKITDLQQLNNSIMQTVDLLYTFEFLTESSENSKIPEQILLAKSRIETIQNCLNEDGSICVDKAAELSDQYRMAAIMAMFSDTYCNFDASYSEKCAKKAELVWEYTENLLNSSDVKSNEYNDERYWAAAQLYKLTGENSYCIITENYIKRDLPTGFSDEETGYLGSLAYLKTTNHTELDLSNQVMQAIFQDAMEVVEESAKDGYLVSVKKAYNEETVPTAFSNARLLILANIISKSVEYVDTACAHMNYVSGRNPLCMNYEKEEQSKYYDEPEVFILTGLMNSYITNE